MRMSPITRNAAPVIAAAQAATDFVGVCFAQCVFRTSILFRAGLASLRRSSHCDIVVFGSSKASCPQEAGGQNFAGRVKSREFRSWGEGSVPPNQGVVPVGIVSVTRSTRRPLARHGEGSKSDAVVCGHTAFHCDKDAVAVRHKIGVRPNTILRIAVCLDSVEDCSHADVAAWLNVDPVAPGVGQYRIRHNNIAKNVRRSRRDYNTAVCEIAHDAFANRQRFAGNEMNSRGAGPGALDDQAAQVDPVIDACIDRDARAAGGTRTPAEPTPSFTMLIDLVIVTAP